MDNAERHHLARQVRELHVPSNTLVIRQGAYIKLLDVYLARIHLDVDVYLARIAA